MRPLSSSLLLALCLLACWCVFALRAEAAGLSKLSASPPLPKGHPRTFPTHAEMEADPALKARYTGANKLNIHMNPHTHDDVGWLKTVDQYYVGANNSIQHAAVRYILDSVVEELMKDPARRFMYVEQAFFQMWYSRQTEAKRSDVRGLVASGQLEFINGGWCMHDEANTHYVDMIDQTTLGHAYLLAEFGVTPKVAWQIDPFGHSATQASLLSGLAGFEALFFGRIDHQDMDQRQAEKNTEFVWRPSPSLGTTGEVFTGVFLSRNYGPPSGFCFDWFCNDTPMITDPTLIDFNVPNRVQAFLDQINWMSASTLGTNLMINMGIDFQYENAREWFDNMDALLEAVNADGRVNLFYSSPSKYVEAKNQENLTYTVKTDDFFPYSDDDHSYWTGYFTSRPAFKRYVRTSSALLQTARQLEIWNGGDGLATLAFSQAVAISQHHDAVAGTARQHVNNDYSQRLHIAETATRSSMATALGQVVCAFNSSCTPPSFVFCEAANISVCATADPEPSLWPGFALLVYNPLSRPREERVSVPIIDGEPYEVTDAQGVVQASQVRAVFDSSAHNAESATLALEFVATVPPLGVSTYFVQLAQKGAPADGVPSHARRGRAVETSSVKPRKIKKRSLLRRHKRSVGGADVTITNGLVSLSFNSSTFALVAYTDPLGVVHPLAHSVAFYESYQGDGQKSGAYIFRPDTENQPWPLQPSGLWTQSGPILAEVTLSYAPWANVTYRLLSGAEQVEVEYTLGPVPVADGVGKEVVFLYSTGLESSATWYADSNAREMQQRVRNWRTSWNYTVTEPISGNYVPMNAAAFLNDGQTQFNVLTDRSQGCTSMQDGTLEIMVHRRLLQDDERGVTEPLNETAWISPYPDFVRQGPGLIITGKHYLLFTNVTSAASAWRPLMQRVYQPLLQAYTSVTDVPAYHAAYATGLSFLGVPSLPPNVDLVSAQSWGMWTQQNNSVLIRLAHQFAVGEDALLSQPASVDLDTLFNASPKTVREVSLTANKDIPNGEKKRRWDTIESDDSNFVTPEVGPVSDLLIVLNPMQIRTFILGF